MAPKVAKRPAAAQVGSAQKKARDHTSSQCKDIAAALQNAEGPSASLRKMLVASVSPTLSQYKDLRHEHQETVVCWIGEALAAHHLSLEKAATEAKANADAAAAEAEPCQAAVAAAEESLARLSEAAAEAQTKSSAAHSEVDAATAALQAAKDVEAGLYADTEAADAKKQNLEALVSDEGSYAKMKSGVAKKKEVDSFVRAAKKHKFEESLLQTLTPVLAKEPATRSEFDNLVLKNFEDAVAQQIAAQTSIIEAAVPGKQQRAGETATAESALTSAETAAEASDAAVKEAQSAVKQGEATLKDAKKALKACGPATKEAASSAKRAEAAVEEFGSGPLAVFKELRDRSSPVEEPAAAEEEAVPAASEDAAATINQPPQATGA